MKPIHELVRSYDAGEVIAVAGVDGNGQSELVRVLAGMTRPDQGSIECLGERSDGRDERSPGVRRTPLQTGSR